MRHTISVKGDDRILEQVSKQLDKLIDVIEVKDLPEGGYVGREIALIKVNCENATRTEILEIANIFRAKAVDIGHRSMILQITGDDDKLNAFINLMESFGILELARTGKVAMVRELNDKSE